MSTLDLIIVCLIIHLFLFWDTQFFLQDFAAPSMNYSCSCSLYAWDLLLNFQMLFPASAEIYLVPKTSADPLRWYCWLLLNCDPVILQALLCPWQFFSDILTDVIQGASAETAIEFLGSKCPQVLDSERPKVQHIVSGKDLSFLYHHHVCSKESQFNSWAETTGPCPNDQALKNIVTMNRQNLQDKTYSTALKLDRNFRQDWVVLHQNRSHNKACGIQRNTTASFLSSTFFLSFAMDKGMLANVL